MYCVRKVTDDLLWIGGNDRQHPLFESAHPVPRGMSFNSYLLLDEKTVLFDTVDRAVEELRAILLAEHCRPDERITQIH